MYELICPSCRQPMRSPFVRIDAVATCPHCQHRYQVKAAHLHRAPVISALGPDETDPLLLGVGQQELANLRESASGHEARVSGVSAGSGSVGVASASATAQANPDAPLVPANVRRSAPPTFATATAASASPAPRPPQTKLKASDRSPATILMFIAIVLVVILAATGLGWLMTHRDQEAGNLGASIQLKFDPNTPVFVGDLQLPSGWRTVSLPASAPDPPGPVQLTDEGTILSGSGIGYGGKVITLSNDPYSLATVQFWLVDASNRRFSTAEMPVVLLTRRTPLLIRITVPQELNDRTSRIESRVILGEKLENSIRLETQDLQVLGSQKSNSIRLRVRNPSSQNVNFLYGVLRGLDDQGRILYQWRIQNSRDLGANQVQEAVIAAPLEPGLNIARWETEFAGLFVNPDAATMSNVPTPSEQR